MRVLHVINNLQPGGAERLVRDLVVELKRHGVDSAVFLLNATGSQFEQEVRKQSIPLFTSGTEPARSPVHALRLAAHLRTERHDVVHAHLFPAQLWTAVARRSSGVKARFITTEHSLTTRRRNAFGRPLDRWMMAHYDRVCCVSHAASRSFAAWLPAETGKIAVVPNGIDLGRFGSAPRDAVLRPFTMLSVGRCEPVKGHDVSIRALSMLPDARLQIAGDGPCRERLARLAAAHRVASRVEFLGRRTDVEALLGDADLFLQSSRSESFGIAALEAMAAGVPVICSDIPGLDEVVGDAALRFPPGNARALASRIRELAAEPEARRRLSSRGLERAKGFGISITANAHLELYATERASI